MSHHYWHGGVSRFVVAVVIYAIKRHSGWPFAHVRQEVFKGTPAVAHFDTSTAVVGVILEVLIETAPAASRTKYDTSLTWTCRGS